ncbi:MAG: hypothetical protein ABSA03_17985 [Streptosporangiaceae bacterium]
MRSPRLVAFPVLRGAYGVILLLAPGATIRLSGAQPPGPRGRRVTRLLGARHLIQAAVTAAAPNSVVLTVGAQADVAHAASILALAIADRPLRRAGLADGLIAAALAAAGASITRSRWRGRETRRARDGEIMPRGWHPAGIR